MKVLKAGGFVFIFIFVIAAVLRIMYPPVPRAIKSLVRISGDREAGTVIFDSRLPLFKSSWLQLIGVPDEDPTTIAVVRSYFEALQRSDDRVSVVVSASSAIDQAMTGVQHLAFKMSAENLNPLAKMLMDAHAKNVKVLLIISSVDASHRAGPSVVRDLEDKFSTQFPVITLAGLALTEEDEPSLKPTCEGTPFSQYGLVFDLACDILSISKKAQVEKPPLDQNLISIEEESPDEELVAIYRARR